MHFTLFSGSAPVLADIEIQLATRAFANPDLARRVPSRGQPRP